MAGFLNITVGLGGHTLRFFRAQCPGLFLFVVWAVVLVMAGSAALSVGHAKEDGERSTAESDPARLYEITQKMAEGESPQDHYLLRLSVSRKAILDSSSSGPEQRTSEHMTTNWGPMELALKLVHNGNHDLDSYTKQARVGLSSFLLKLSRDWKTLDRQKRLIKDMDKIPKDSPAYRNYRAWADALPTLERQLRSADAHAEDARRMLRLIQGVLEYHYASSQTAAELSHYSGPVQARFFRSSNA